MNRRGFFGLLGAAAAIVIAPEFAELLVPTRTIFLPPTGGWIGRNQLLTIKYIAEEAMRVLSQNVEFEAMINREYDHCSFLEVSDDGGKTFKPLPFKHPGAVRVFRPPRFHQNAFQFTTADLGSAPNDRITFGGKSWPS